MFGGCSEGIPSTAVTIDSDGGRTCGCGLLEYRPRFFRELVEIFFEARSVDRQRQADDAIETHFVGVESVEDVGVDCLTRQTTGCERERQGLGYRTRKRIGSQNLEGLAFGSEPNEAAGDIGEVVEQGPDPTVLNQDQPAGMKLVKGVEDLGECFLADADEIQALSVVAGLVPALASGDGEGRDPGAMECAGETAPDLAHADDVNTLNPDFNHRRIG
jgi:hypothetical protein